jgi:OmpA-OmpF porin, OOP family
LPNKPATGAQTDSRIKGYGKTLPVASNSTPDGKDDPVGRQKNRRVEIAVDTCS